ncbi:MAG: hypothetical protein EBY16_04115 [Gammaproteobacteria bacterium]|nr:hypothetical protein [Gammaproteobacteria bacterium]
MRVNNANLRNLMFSAILGIFSVTVAHAGTCVAKRCSDLKDCNSACGYCMDASPGGKIKDGRCGGSSGQTSKVKSAAR